MKPCTAWWLYSNGVCLLACPAPLRLWRQRVSVFSVFVTQQSLESGRGNIWAASLRCSACFWRRWWTSSQCTGRTCRTGFLSCSLSCWKKWGLICWAPFRPKSRRPWISQGLGNQSDRYDWDIVYQVVLIWWKPLKNQLCWKNELVF